MNLTNLVAGILVGVIFYFVAIAVIGSMIPQVAILLLSVLIGLIVYKQGVSL